MRIPHLKPVQAARRRAAYTFAEMMVTTGIFMIMMAGALYAYLFGLSLYQITKIKLAATDDARNALVKLTDDIRSANLIQIGGGNLTNFTQVTNNAQQFGNSIQIYPTAGSSNYSRYFYDTNVNSTTYSKLVKTTNNTSWELVVANSISNYPKIFTSEDAFGNILTNNMNNRVIGLTMQFYQIKYPLVSVGPGYFYEFYQLKTKITRRTLY